MAETDSSDVKENPKSSECEDVFGGPVFEPRLYIQRYFYVQQELEKFGVKHIVDFGSAECKISRFLVRIPTLEKLALVDLDLDLLESNRYAIRPLTCDFIEKRDLPLQVQMYCGNVTELDSCLTGCDGVSMVEIVEHLVPDVLHAAVEMVFGQLQPRVVVITTPNADFNQLFPNFSGFRHWDHKFEWSRQEFQTWCDEICRRWPYTVEFGGVGEPPLGSEHLGPCSQAAVFVRDPDAQKENHTSFVTDHYRLITESFYPYKERKISEEETILLEIDYQLRQYKNCMVTMTGSCEMCAFNRSDHENEVSTRNQEEIISGTECFNLNTDSNGNQNLLIYSDQLIDRNFNYESYKSRDQSSESVYNNSRNQSIKSVDSSCNQSSGDSNSGDQSAKSIDNHLWNQSTESGDSSRNQCSIGGNSWHQFTKSTDNHLQNQSTESGDISGDQSTESAFDKVTECPYCANSGRQLNENECYVPVASLLSRKMKTLLQPDQLRQFLLSHGYRMSADGDYVIVTVDNDEDDDEEEDDDDDAKTDQLGSELDPTCSSELPSNRHFSLNEALECESWD